MDANLMRTVFGVLYWLCIAGAGYRYRNLFFTDIRPTFDTYLGPFSEVGMIAAVLVVMMGLAKLQEAIVNTLQSLALKVGDSGGGEAGDTFGKDLLKSARKLERRRDYVNAAEAYESLGMWPEAAACHEKAGSWSRAAAALENAGERGRAVDFYERDGNHEAAAALAETAGMRERAMRNYRFAGEKALAESNFTRAADCLSKAGDPARAGEIYVRLRRDFDALRCFVEAGDIERLEELFKKVEPHRVIPRTESSAAMIGRVAELFLSNGKAARAGEILEAAGMHAEAGAAFEKAREWVRAGEAFMRSGDLDRANSTFSQVSDRAVVAGYRARIAQEKGNWAEAGACLVEAGKLPQAVDAFRRAKDFRSAAEVYEKMKRYLMAAEMYTAARDHQAAAVAYINAHDWAAAATSYESCGDAAKAADAHINAGNYYKAGILSLKTGDFEGAIEHLQRVPTTSTDWRMATAFLGLAFIERGQATTARDVLARVMKDLAPSIETLPVFYKYGRICEQHDMKTAIDMYRAVQRVDIGYEDVEKRIKKLDELRRAESGKTQSQSEFQVDSADSVDESPPARPARRTPSQRTDTPPPPQPADDRPPSTGFTRLPSTRFGAEGRYTILQELGRGGMAIVYKAMDEHLQREVALKTFPFTGRGGSAREEVFLREARTVARLSHPNIVTIFDSGHMENLYYIAMEFIPGDNLKTLVKRRGPLSMEDTRSGMRQLCDALVYAHEQSVLHLDIKPGNVIRRVTGDIKVVDFGLARIIHDAAAQGLDPDDSQPTLVGTPQYMAPEQILGGDVGERTDIYALGLTLFYIVTGHTPFDIKRITDPAEISRLQIHGSFPRPSTLRATLPPKVDGVFMRCTQKSASDRYPNVRALLDDINAM